ncbi:uncharacterized protein ACMZJ9_020651, partial [Mantella aurantiaca]
MKVEVKKEEEETLVSGDQQSMEEGERNMEIKKEESSLHMDTTDGHFAGNRKTSEGDFILSPDYNTEDNDITQYSPEEKPLPHNIHHRPDQLEGSMDPSNPEESSIRDEGDHTGERSTDPSYPKESSRRHERDHTGERSTDPSNPKESSIRHERDHTGKRSTDPSNPEESSIRHERDHTGE